MKNETISKAQLLVALTLSAMKLQCDFAKLSAEECEIQSLAGVYTAGALDALRTVLDYLTDGGDGITMADLNAVEFATMLMEAHDKEEKKMRGVKPSVEELLASLSGCKLN